MANIDSYLRGHGGSDSANNFLSSLIDRHLQEDESDSSSSSSSRKDNDSFLILTAAIVALILVFYALCMYQLLYRWMCRICCGRQLEVGGPNETVIIHEGHTFNLSDNQRRAVLEAIFSENSKPATDNDVSQKRRKKSGKDVDLPSDVEFPGVSMSETDTSAEGPHTSPRHSTSTSGETDADAMDDECSSEGDIACHIAGDDDEHENEDETCSGESLRSSSYSVEDSMDVMNNLAQTPEAVRTVFENETPAPNETPSPYNATASEVTPLDLTIPDLSEVCRTLPWQDESAAEDSSGSPTLATLSIPTLNAGLIHTAGIPENKSFEFEECKEEIENPMEESVGEEPFDSPALHLPLPLVRRESFTTTASEFTYDDESTVGHACPICLGGYKKGDMLSASKHCPHMFHKDCILEWLEQHNECPMCRVKMITDNEMNKAATSLVGKTRMYRAVAAYQPAPRTPRAAPSVPNSRTHTSPFLGTMRRSAQQNDS